MRAKFYWPIDFQRITINKKLSKGVEPEWIKSLGSVSTSIPVSHFERQKDRIPHLGFCQI